MDHHRFTQDAHKDPELEAAKPVTLFGYLWYVTGLPFARAQLRALVVHAVGRVSDHFVAVSVRPRVVGEARLHLVLYAMVATAIVMGWTAPLYFWLVPAVLGQPFLRLVLLAEHTGCAPNSDMYANTRTTLSNWLVRFVMWNMPYHVAHHVYPGIPFCALRAAHRAMAPVGSKTATGYAIFHGSYIRALITGKGPAFVIGG
jgi:fatty acid desaturase